MRIKRNLIILCLVCLLAPAVAQSQEQNNWDFELAPLYLWAINIDGDLGIRGRTASASIGFSDIWDNLQGVFTTRFSMLYKQKFGLLIDYNYLDLGKEKASGAGNIEASFTSQILNLGATYRVLQGQHTWDALAGIRYIYLDSGIDLNDAGVSLSGDQDWVDPIFGARYTLAFADKWSLRLYGDIGGFGVSSDFTWQGLGLIDFQPWRNVAIVAGYRAIYSDYSDDGFTFDATTHGPVVGIDIRW